MRPVTSALFASLRPVFRSDQTTVRTNIDDGIAGRVIGILDVDDEGGGSCFLVPLFIRR